VKKNRHPESLTEKLHGLIVGGRGPVRNRLLLLSLAARRALDVPFPVILGEKVIVPKQAAKDLTGRRGWLQSRLGLTVFPGAWPWRSSPSSALCWCMMPTADLPRSARSTRRNCMHILVNGVRLFVDVANAGLVADGYRMREKPVLLMLHGGPGFDHVLFKDAFSALSDVAQVIFYDHRGNGRSEGDDPSTWNLA
jgi:proline iminopeptidase